MIQTVSRIISSLLTLYMMIIFVRIVMTWFSGVSYGRVQAFLASLTDPYLSWFRHNTPIRFEMFGSTIFLFGADLANMVVALLIFAGIVAMVHYTKSGIAIRATAEDQSTAYSMGISVPKVFSRAWVLASTTGAVAGAILATRNGISPSLGLFGFSVLAIVLMGGLDSYLGVFVAAMVVGVLEALTQWQFGGDWAGIVPYVAVLLVILIRPHGLFGSKEIERI